MHQSVAAANDRGHDGPQVHAEDPAGVWERVFKYLAKDADNEYAMIDSNIVRAHQHSAGANRAAGKMAAKKRRDRPRKHRKIRNERSKVLLLAHPKTSQLPSPLLPVSVKTLPRLGKPNGGVIRWGIRLVSARGHDPNQPPRSHRRKARPINAVHSPIRATRPSALPIWQEFQTSLAYTRGGASYTQVYPPHHRAPLFREQRRSAFDHAHENGIPALEVMVKGGPDMQGHKAGDG